MLPLWRSSSAGTQGGGLIRSWSGNQPDTVPPMKRPAGRQPRNQSDLICAQVVDQRVPSGSCRGRPNRWRCAGSKKKGGRGVGQGGGRAKRGGVGGHSDGRSDVEETALTGLEDGCGTGKGVGG